jgi:hypothetical protein
MVGKAQLSGRLATAAALTISILALAAPSALGFDGRSPDTRAASAATSAATDARSPDARVAAQGGQSALGSYVDAASRAHPSTPVASPTPARVGGFDWSDFAVGLGTGAGSILIVALLAALGLSSRGRRRGSARPATS